MARMFGTDGIRGTANLEPMTPETALALGRAAMQVLAPCRPSTKPRVVVGRDTRQSGPMLESALIAGLCSAGADVLNVGVFPTPGVAYLTRTLGALAGVMISASHNPYADNGIKFFSAAGTKLDDPIEAAIEAYVRTPPPDARPTGQAVGKPMAPRNTTRRYLDFLKSTCRHPPSSRLRIGLDCANGAASRMAPTLFAELGARVQVWHADPDGTNINHQCGALYPAFLQQQIRAANLDVGFAFDGDADRLIAIDQTGEILDGDYILAICARSLIEEGLLSPRTVVSTVMANLGLEHALRQQGVTLHTTQVGDKYVAQALRQHQAILGGEQSGHIIFMHHHTTGDGLLTAVQLLNAMTLHQASLAELSRVLRKFPQVLVNVRLSERRDPLRLPQVRQVVQQTEARLGDQGRVLVRLSGTERVARVMVEGPDQTVIEPLAQQIAAAITGALGAP